MAFQIQGISAVVAEVETNTRAIRTVQRPDDYGSLGVYSIAQISGTANAGLGGASNIYAFRNTTANVYLVRQVRLSAGNTATAFAAGVAQFNLFVARSFTVDSSGGTAATLTTNNTKRRTSMATTGLARSRILSAAALGAGTWTLDAQPIGAAVAAIKATAGIPVMPPVYLWDSRDTEYPLVCEQNEGFTVQCTVPATGTWQFTVGVDWLELASF